MVNSSAVLVLGRVLSTNGEETLWKIIPPEEGSDLCHRFVMHGRAVCNARKPECEKCCLNDICRYAAENAVLTKETKEASV